MTTIRLALLLCDTPIPSVRSVHGTYLDIFRKLLQTSLAQSLESPQREFELDGYDVVLGKYPSEGQLSQYDGILISGSAASAYAPLPWIPPLLEFLSNITSNHPQVKIIGICFGQQVVARALGGECVPNEKGWEVGVYDVDLTPVGQLIFGRDKLRIQQMHRDHVPATPPNFQLIGYSPKCAVQGIVLPYTSEVRSLADVHVLCVQGHPEFVPSIVQKIIDAREASGVLDEAVARDARYRAEQEHDGVDVIARVIWRLFGVSFS